MYVLDDFKINKLYHNLDQTIAKKFFYNNIYPWELIPFIRQYIIKLGNTLNMKKYTKINNNIWIAKSSKIAITSFINGPAIIGENTKIRHCAFIRKNVLIGNNVIVGNSTEIKNSIIFNNVKIPHYNYIGDSIIGFNSHLGAGVIISNTRLDKKKIIINNNLKKIETKLKKFGAILCDNVEIGCNSVLNPGTIIKSNNKIYPLSYINGVISSNYFNKIIK